MGRLLSTDLFSLLVETFVSVSIVLLLLSGTQPGRRLMCSGVKIRSGPLRPGSGDGRTTSPACYFHLSFAWAVAWLIS
ncbi:hypothetical protein GQ55_4G113600 [Panicum hallii var. hallii]|uniref:Uncharacterized protein n=1 Tax=Panicum hallii var. hallii TaxID=1504633 RepID=A0A2T7DXL5_9POAL|nr:hypothetical protein GQ55_4G113600 [Panicum hallii var. hallii]